MSWATASSSEWLSALWSILPAYALSLACALGCVRLCVALRQAGSLSPLVSRKAMHVLTGPAFCCLWPLYPQPKAFPSLSPSLAASLSPFVASSVPLLSALYFLAVGSGAVTDAGLVSAVARTGDRRELRVGPFLYGLVHCVACAAYWTASPVGLFLLLILCVGDGVADLAGRWSATRPALWRPLPWNAGKTAVGSGCMLAASLLSMAAFASAALQVGLLPHCSGAALLRCGATLAAVATAVESLPIPHVDNLTTFVGGVLASHWGCPPPCGPA